MGAVAAVARLIYLNLARQFPVLLTFLVFLAAIDIGFGLEDQRSALYFWSYIVLEPLECIFGIIAVRELLALTFSDYPGIRTVGRWSMYAGIALSLTLSLLATGFFWSGGALGRAHSHLYYLEISKRAVVFGLAVVIVTILLCLSRYPLHLGRNTLVSSLCFSALFLSEAARLLLDSLMPKLHNHFVDGVESGFIFFCLIGWAVFLRPESATAAPQIHYSSAGEDDLLRQLNSLNALLARAARR
ncbi:MAG TPA: hypothetical protein VG297_21880 [Bryobacteraceae bacterium]|nr:hypothetical protein [Bryobacteraceae bacterium]